MALNDGARPVRATALRLVGRLACRNPAYVGPALRRHLLQLLTDMAHSPDSRQRDDSAHLVHVLIDAAPQLVMPYVSPIHKVSTISPLHCRCMPKSDLTAKPVCALLLLHAMHVVHH